MCKGSYRELNPGCSKFGWELMSKDNSQDRCDWKCNYCGKITVHLGIDPPPVCDCYRQTKIM